MDINVELLYGFKVSLEDVFKYKLLKPDIIEDDDWQLCDDMDVVKRNVISSLFLELLENQVWQIHIQTATQGKSDLKTSFLFIYNKKQTLCDKICDYKVGEIDTNCEYPFEVHDYLKKLIDDYQWNYKIHWIVDCSW